MNVRIVVDVVEHVMSCEARVAGFTIALRGQKKARGGAPVGRCLGIDGVERGRRSGVEEMIPPGATET